MYGNKFTNIIRQQDEQLKAELSRAAKHRQEYIEKYNNGTYDEKAFTARLPVMDKAYLDLIAYALTTFPDARLDKIQSSSAFSYKGFEYEHYGVISFDDACLNKIFKSYWEIPTKAFGNKEFMRTLTDLRFEDSYFIADKEDKHHIDFIITENPIDIPDPGEAHPMMWLKDVPNWILEMLINLSCNTSHSHLKIESVSVDSVTFHAGAKKHLHTWFLYLEPMMLIRFCDDVELYQHGHIGLQELVERLNYYKPYCHSSLEGRWVIEDRKRDI